MKLTRGMLEALLDAISLMDAGPLLSEQGICSERKAIAIHSNLMLAKSWVHEQLESLTANGLTDAQKRAIDLVLTLALTDSCSCNSPGELPKGHNRDCPVRMHARQFRMVSVLADASSNRWR